MDFRFQLVFGLACLSSSIFAQSRHCIIDQDLEDVQEYSYHIPGSDQKDYWKGYQLNYYTFGKFDSSNTEQETTITAGIYKGSDLIYKTEINCDQGIWKNTVLDNHRKEKTILRGKIDRNLTRCREGENFDLILKVNNWYRMNWILNAQPLQHDTMAKKIKFVCGTDRTTKDRIVPAVRTWSKHRSYEATRVVLKATGRAKFDRFVFGQCDAWPKSLAKFENYCQRVYHWSWARSKANESDENLNQLLKERGPFTEGLRNGLGVFGNNRVEHIPRCFTTKYFYYYMSTVHPDRKLPIFFETSWGWKSRNLKRAYCCNIDMVTGQIRENNFEKFCYDLNDCRYNLLDEASRKIVSETDPSSIVRKMELKEGGKSPSTVSTGALLC